jgi:PAS domain S-box-containing protein
MSESRLKILLVEDNPGDARLIGEMFREASQIQFELELADRLSTGLARIRANDIHAVLLDLGLPDSQGIETFLAAHAGAPQLPIVVLTGLGDEALALKTVQEGAQDYLVKGKVDPGLLERTVRYAVERKKAEQALRSSERALRQSEASFRSLVLNSPYAIFRTSVGGRLLDANPALVDMLGYQSDAELVASDLFADICSDPKETKQLAELFESQKPFRGAETRCKRRDGKLISVSFTGRPVRDEKGSVAHFEIIADDITDRRSLEAQFRQAQKMESVGRLAGGVAHDFNNLLAVILGYSEVLADRLEQDPELHKHAEEIRKAGLRAASLTRQLLAFSRQQYLEPTVLNLNTIVTDMGKMLQRLIHEDIELTTLLEPMLGSVKADQGQIEQVIMNLAVNARDAMPKGGELTIQTLNVEVDDAYARQHGHISKGSFVMLAVSDTGLGMDVETQSHIFEPFFTTKELGKGTGLGLATVYGVVKQSGGFIWVYSELGLGTTFKILLPRVKETVRSVMDDTNFEQSPRGSETILVVEDDACVRDLTTNLLSNYGYNVLEAANGLQALNIARQKRDGQIHLLLTDVVMPGMNGPQIADEVVSLHPRIKILYMSGYAPSAAGNELNSRRGRILLQKPFTKHDLACKVREALDANGVALSPPSSGESHFHS